MKDIEKAILYATKKHAGQTRRDGSPYIYHPIAVADELRKAGFDEKYQIVGVLHDILEDTDATEAEVGEFGEDVLEAVKLLTKPEGMPEDQYVSAILENRMATIVKSVDKAHNVWSAANCASVGDVRDPDDIKYAKKYIGKAKTYYLSKFNRALDSAIGEANAGLRHLYVQEREAIIRDPRKLKLFRDEKAEHERDMREMHDTTVKTDYPDFTAKDLEAYQIGNNWFVSFGLPLIPEELKQWRLTPYGWLRSQTMPADHMNDFEERTMDDLKTAVLDKKAKGYFRDYVTEDLI